MPAAAELLTPRLRLRAFVLDDWRGLREYVTREDVMRYDRPWPASEEGLREAVAYLAAHEGYWAVCLLGRGELVGHVVCTRAQPEELRRWDLGVGLDPRAQGQGLAYEACERVLRHAFEERGARRVTASCHPANERAWRLLERLGMRREAHHVQSGFLRRAPDGEPLWNDVYEYALLADEWRGRAG